MLENRPFRGEIYLHWNTVSQKGYVGQTTQGVEVRWADHVKSSKRKSYAGYNYPIARAIRKYGKNAFELYILAEASSKEELDKLERLWIWTLGTRENGYNLALGGEGNLGLKHTPETKAKISKVHLGNKYCVGRECSEETRQKMSKKRKGMILPEDWRQKIAAAGRGKKHSAETKAKIAAGNTGKTFSAETRQKMSAGSKGNTRCLGRIYSPETLAKIAARPRDAFGHFLKNSQVQRG